MGQWSPCSTSAASAPRRPCHTTAGNAAHKVRPKTAEFGGCSPPLKRGRGGGCNGGVWLIATASLCGGEDVPSGRGCRRGRRLPPLVHVLRGGGGGVSPCAPPPSHNSGIPPPCTRGLVTEPTLRAARPISARPLPPSMPAPLDCVPRGGGGGASAHCRNVHHRHHNIHKGPQGGPAVVTRANTVWGTRLLIGPLLLLHYRWVAWASRPPHDLQKPNGGGNEGGGGGGDALVSEAPWGVLGILY